MADEKKSDKVETPEEKKVDVKSSVTILLGAALAVSEALAMIPGIESNSIFQLVLNIITALNKGSGQWCRSSAFFSNFRA